MSILIKNGFVIDPANRTETKLDIYCEDGRITEIGIGLSNEADEVIDAIGLIVCPGFIDIHMHEDPVNADGDIENNIFNCMLRMGVTSVLGGNCGDNACDPGDYLEKCDRGVPVNVAMLAGHGYARYAEGCSDKYAVTSKEQKNRISDRLKRALQAGCAGVSFGLRYVPGTDREEFLKAASAVEGTGKLITAHVRDDAEAIFKSIDEVSEAAKLYKAPLQISHIGSMAGFGQMRKVLSKLDNERLQGLDVMLDCYPYEAFSTTLGAATYDDGWLERYNCGYDVLEFCEGPMAGKRADEDSFNRFRSEMPEMLTVCHVMKAEDVELALKHPSVLVASDGILNGANGHPRASGTFPRVFCEYVNKGKLSLKDAIAKMTYMPAKRIGIRKKGSLSIGNDADIVMFDLSEIRDSATFKNPVAAPIGIKKVIIDGRIAVDNGKIVNGKLGRSIRI